MQWEVSRENLTEKWHDQIPIFKYHGACYIKNEILGPNTRGFLKAGRAEVAMDIVQGRSDSGLGQSGSDRGGDHVFDNVALIPEEQWALKGETQVHRAKLSESLPE